jgi:nucleoside-diphosphate-sugar epimerase
MNEDILITGANGFIGKKMNYGKAFEGRLDDIDSIFKQTNGITGIIHLAGKSDKRLCDADPTACIDSNLVGLCNILNIAMVKKIWVLFISTYQIKENHLYGLSKLMGEELCRVYKKKGVDVRILRLPIVYGIGGNDEKVVNKMINKIKNGEEITIDNNDKFFFAYIDDIIKMIESEVSVIKGNGPIDYSIRDLISGIREVLKGGLNDKK